jgi:hypothetical protein
MELKITDHYETYLQTIRDRFFCSDLVAIKNSSGYLVVEIVDLIWAWLYENQVTFLIDR